MNGDKIDSILTNDAKCGRMFIGVFACDRLPTKLDAGEPTLLVCNTDPHDKPGQHWVVLYVEDSSYGEFFDSFGRPPDAPFKDFLNRHCTRWIFNEKHLQSLVSHVCGHYCIFYCIHRARNKNINAIINLLTSDTGLNDYLVHNYVCKTFKM
jgi:hypothetical protein